MSVQQWSETVILGELGDDPQFTDDLTTIIEQCTKDPRQDVLLNLSGVNYLNSSNIAHLLKLRKLVTITNHRRLKLAGVNRQVWGVFLVTGLDRIFEFVDDVPSGLAARGGYEWERSASLEAPRVLGRVRPADLTNLPTRSAALSRTTRRACHTSPAVVHAATAPHAGRPRRKYHATGLHGAV